MGVHKDIFVDFLLLEQNTLRDFDFVNGGRVKGSCPLDETVRGTMSTPAIITISPLFDVRNTWKMCVCAK